jgi:hypothetical protein
MQSGVRCRELDHRESSIHDLWIPDWAKVGDQFMRIEIPERKLDTLEDGLCPSPRRPSRNP